MLISPDYRQFLSEALPLMLLGFAGMTAYHYLPKSDYVTYAFIIAYALLILTLTTRYAILKAYSWEIGAEKICRKHGVLTRQTDYIELYRVVDYRETQTFSQRLLGVKTVVIISTDKSDPQMPIKGVPSKIQLVEYTRKLVELNKKQAHVYEIANR